MHDIDWNALKYILKVAETRSTARAAKALGVNPTTVMRKITAFEQRSGLRLFRRKQTGYETTLECDTLVDQIRRMEDRASIIQGEILGLENVVHGTLTVSTTDSAMTAVLGPCFATFTERNPTIQITVSVSTDRVNLNRKDADIALRGGVSAPQNSAKALSGLAFCVYADCEMQSSWDGTPLRDLPWIAPGGGLKRSTVHDWMKANVPPTRVRITADTFLTARTLAESRIGAAVLPCCLGDTAPSLSRFGDPIADIQTTLWIMVAADLEEAPRARLFVDHMEHAIAEYRDLLEGRCPADGTVSIS
ncbi:MAG: LysR family transcriptional regulator [Pseudomonadota bacterium]